MAQTLINKQQASHLVLTTVGSGQIIKESLDTYQAQLIWDIKVDRKNGKILSKKKVSSQTQTLLPLSPSGHSSNTTNGIPFSSIKNTLSQRLALHDDGEHPEYNDRNERNKFHHHDGSGDH